MTIAQPSTINASFISFIVKPAAINVNATHIYEEFICQMYRKCFSYKSTIHSKKDGDYKCDLYAYCKHISY